MEDVAEEGKNLTIRITWRWILNKCAVEGEWSIIPEGEAVISGKMLTGWDSAEGRIVGGGMNSMGGYSMGTTTHDHEAKSWATQSEGADAKGEKTSATVVMTLKDPNTLIWQSKNRQGGSLTGDSPEYTFKRAAAAQPRRPLPDRPSAGEPKESARTPQAGGEEKKG
jgi:hypothetical protein